ncbi:hypothetical protein [Clostridium manihotivorum]|uniref:hypothetical protein n=1 Tax=Clostridium manihotivorum TaxID=2320868 RepID=UPI00196AAA5D|nr:hypothetical protein [Clostridium manihotivorum]
MAYGILARNTAIQVFVCIILKMLSKNIGVLGEIEILLLNAIYKDIPIKSKGYKSIKLALTGKFYFYYF